MDRLRNCSCEKGFLKEVGEWNEQEVIVQVPQ